MKKEDERGSDELGEEEREIAWTVTNHESALWLPFGIEFKLFFSL